VLLGVCFLFCTLSIAQRKQQATRVHRGIWRANQGDWRKGVLFKFCEHYVKSRLHLVERREVLDGYFRSFNEVQPTFEIMFTKPLPDTTGVDAQWCVLEPVASAVPDGMLLLLLPPPARPLTHAVGGANSIRRTTPFADERRQLLQLPSLLRPVRPPGHRPLGAVDTLCGGAITRRTTKSSIRGRPTDESAIARWCGRGVRCRWSWVSWTLSTSASPADRP